MPDKAGVFVRNNTAYVVEGHLKVMLEEDYLALTKNTQGARPPKGVSLEKDTHAIASQIVHDIVLPELEREVNTGKNFAPLRQIFYSLVLASWYKQNLKDALLNQVYTDKAKVNGVNVADKAIGQKIYQQYLEAYKKGVFNYIKEDTDRLSHQPIPRKYSSGGVRWNFKIDKNPAMAVVQKGLGPDGAMLSIQTTIDAAMREVSDAQKRLLDSDFPTLVEMIQRTGVSFDANGQLGEGAYTLAQRRDLSKRWQEIWPQENGIRKSGRLAVLKAFGSSLGFGAEENDAQRVAGKLAILGASWDTIEALTVKLATQANPAMVGTTPAEVTHLAPRYFAASIYGNGEKFDRLVRELRSQQPALRNTPFSFEERNLSSDGLKTFIATIGRLSSTVTISPNGDGVGFTQSKPLPASEFMANIKPDGRYRLLELTTDKIKYYAVATPRKKQGFDTHILQIVDAAMNAAATEGERTAETVTGEDFQELVDQRAAGKAGFHLNVDPTPVIPAAESAVLDVTKIPMNEQERLVSSEAQMYGENKIGEIVMAGGEATRFGGPKTFVQVVQELGDFLQIKVANLRWAMKKFGTRIPLYILSSERRLAEFKRALEERKYYEMDPLVYQWYVQGVVDTFIPTDEEIEANFKGSAEVIARNKQYAQTLRAANPDGIYRSQGERRFVPGGHFDAIASFIISGRLTEALKKGIEYAPVFNIDNLQAVLKNDGVVAHFAEQGYDFGFILAEKNLTFTVKDKTGNVVGDKIIVRFRDNVVSFDGVTEFKGQAEKDGLRFVINQKDKKLDVFDIASGNLIETEQNVKAETGGTLVQPVDAQGRPTGNPIMKEGFELKPDFPHVDAPLFNTNTVIVRLRSLLKFMGITEEQLANMSFEERSRIVREKLVKQIKPNFEFKNHEVDGEYPALGEARNGKTRISVVQLTRIMLQVAHIPGAKVGYYFAPRASVFAPVKEPQDKEIAAANNLESLRSITDYGVALSESAKVMAVETIDVANTYPDALKADLTSGTAGTRGKTGESTDTGYISRPNIGRMAQAWANHIKSDPEMMTEDWVEVGYDMRPNSDAFALRFVEVLAANGIKFKLASEATTTPSVNSQTNKSRAGRPRYAFIITASHNPLPDNGIKFLKDGAPAPNNLAVKVTKAANNITSYQRAIFSSENVQALLENGEITSVHPAEDTRQSYRNRFAGLAQSLKTYKAQTGAEVTLDFMYGAASAFKDVFEGHGINVIEERTIPMSKKWEEQEFRDQRFLEPGKGEVPYRPEPKDIFLSKTDFENFKEGSLYAAIDGDGDRLAIWVKNADGTVQEVAPNDLGVLYGWYMIKNGLTEGRRTIAKTRPTTIGMNLLVAWANKNLAPGEREYELVKTPVGSNNFGPYFQTGDLLLGTEESGHQVVGEFDDASYQLQLVLEILAKTGKSLSEIIMEAKTEIGQATNVDLNNWIYERINPDLTPAVTQKLVDPLRNGRPEAVVEAFAAALGSRKEIKEIAFTTIDSDFNSDDITYEQFKQKSVKPQLRQNEGLIIEFIDGSWLMVRISGTEGVVRLYAEAANEADMKFLQSAAKQAIGLDQALIASGPNKATYYDEDQASITNGDVLTRGGIDFNVKNLNTSVSGDKVDIHFDKAMMAQFERGDFSGVRPVIMSVTPIPSVLPWLGLSPGKEYENFLAKAGI